MFERAATIFLFGLTLLNLAFEKCSSEGARGNYGEFPSMVSCFEPSFESLEIPGRGVLMVHKGHRLIPVFIPAETEFCDDPRGLQEPEQDIWDHLTLVPKDHEEFSQLVNEVKSASEKNNEIVSALNDIINNQVGAKTDSNDLHVGIEAPIIPVHAFPLHGNTGPHARTELTVKNDDLDEISDFEDSLLLDELDIAKNDESDGVRMRMLMFAEFSRTYLEERGLFLAISGKLMYSPENFEFFRQNWPTREAGLVMEELPSSIWKAFLASGVLTSPTSVELSEERRKSLVLESLNAFFNGLERFYLQNMESELNHKYYSYLSGLGVEKAIETIKYYVESEKTHSLDRSRVSESSESQKSSSSELSATSISSSSLEIPETSAESSISGLAPRQMEQQENSAVNFDVSQGEALQRSFREEPPVGEGGPGSQLEIFASLRVKWFSIFVSDYLARLGINFKISPESCSRPRTIEFFRTEFGVPPGLPEVVWDMFTENSFGSRFPESATVQEQMEIVYDLWVTFNKVEHGLFEGNVSADGYILNKDLLEVEIREIMRQYWDENMGDTAAKLIRLSKQRNSDHQAASEIESIREDELIRNQKKAREMGIFNVDKSNSELSMSNQEGLEVGNGDNKLEASRILGSSSGSTESSEKLVNNRSRRRGRKRGGKKRARRGRSRRKSEEKEQQMGVLERAKGLLESLRSKDKMEDGPDEKKLSSGGEVSSESSSLEPDKSSYSPFDWLRLESPMNGSNESEFSAEFGRDDVSEKEGENSQGPGGIGIEPSLSQMKEKPERSVEEPGRDESLVDLMKEQQEQQEQEKSEIFEVSLKVKEASPEKSPVEIAQINLLEDIPPVDSESVSTEGSVSRQVGFLGSEVQGENSLKEDEAEAEAEVDADAGTRTLEEGVQEKSLQGEKSTEPEHKTLSGAAGNVGSELGLDFGSKERSKADYKPVEEVSEDATVSAQGSPKESEEDEKPEGGEDASGEEKPLQKKLSKRFEDKLSSLLDRTKKLFGFGKKPPKENGDDSSDEGERDKELDLEMEYENLTNMVIYFIQTYAALRYKFIEEGVVDSSFEEINKIIKSSIHFHQGTAEFDNVDMEKGIKKIASMLGGGSFTALKSVGLTAKDITASLKRYLLRLCPGDKTEEEYKRNKRLNTTHFWLRQHFSRNWIREGMLPEQLERPSIVESSHDLLESLDNPKPVEDRAEAICGKIYPILGRFFDKSLTSEIKIKDLNCLAVVTTNELYGFSMSNSIYLFLFRYNTTYWRFLSPDISISISQALEKE